MDTIEQLDVKWNIELIGYERGKKKVLHQRTHNIVVTTGRQMICEALSALSFGTGTFTRKGSSVIRYIGFGIGGTRQNTTDASTSPLSDSYPSGYGGTNTQTDADITVGQLERPVKATSGLWMREVAAPADYPTARSVRWTAHFLATDINVSPYTNMPISEIALFTSDADPTLPNGGAGTYPGPTGFVAAYDTFLPIYKTAFFNIEARWTYTL